MNPSGLSEITRITDARTRSICAENPTGAKGGGARASLGDDRHCTAAARDLGRGWKVRPCLVDFEPGQTLTLADIEGPGVVQHVWITVLDDVHRGIALRVYYDDAETPSIVTPLGDFFANGLDGRAIVNSLPMCVNPKGGMNSYWPMPFRRRIRIELTNDGHETIPHVFYQVDYELRDVPDDAGYLHALWRRSMTTREHPEHEILPTIRGRGQYVGTSIAWTQLSAGWWGEGEVKFFIDGDGPDSPTICGTGTEDYFGGAWGFVMEGTEPTTFSTPFLGYPQAIYGVSPLGPRPPAHGLYRWHIPDPIRFSEDLRVTVQALGWWPGTVYQPLTDDIASVAYWYQHGPNADPPDLPPMSERLPR
jgi:hypothetical protein